MSKTYVKEELSDFRIEVSEPPIPVESVTETRFSNFRCWREGRKRISVKEAEGMTHFQIAQKLLEISSPGWFGQMSDDAELRLTQSRKYILRRHGKEHFESATVYETTLGLLRQNATERDV